MKSDISKAAKALSALGASKGGKARAKKLSPERRTEIARNAVNARWSTCDVAVAGETIPAGSRVILITGSAGRDERKYPNPDVFDVHRKFDAHMTLGYGGHFCLGAALARMEARVGLEETLKRWPEWKVDRDQVVPLYTSTVRGPQQLPIFV